jgi:2-polyprenyl-3-methyl-5-hydroxy-6-metoxy-1,4-benzoquinol methylase
MSTEPTSRESVATSNEDVRNWYERSYGDSGLAAQRRYPNEELCRFMGRNFFAIPREERAAVRILEAGCGSGANLWMLAREGFETHGIDISEQSIALAGQMLASYGCTAQLKAADMIALPYPESYFDAVVDVFSSYCLPASSGSKFVQSVRNVLKPGSLFFSYFPAKMSDAYTNRKPAALLDADTLAGIHRKDSPFAGNHYPFRFLHPAEYERLLLENGFEVRHSETVSRTYNNRRETFYFNSIEARKT